MLGIILSSLAYVKGGSLNQGHSHGLGGIIGGGFRRENHLTRDSCQAEHSWGMTLPQEQLSQESTYDKKSTKVTASATKASSTTPATSRMTSERSVWIIEP